MTRPTFTYPQTRLFSLDSSFDQRLQSRIELDQFRGRIGGVQVYDDLVWGVCLPDLTQEILGSRVVPGSRYYVLLLLAPLLTVVDASDL